MWSGQSGRYPVKLYIYGDAAVSANENKLAVGPFTVEIGTTYSFVIVKNEFHEYFGRSIVKIPAAVTNTSGQTASMERRYTCYDADGREAQAACWGHVEEEGLAATLRPGESLSGYFYVVYRGDGDYCLEFHDENSADVTRVIVPIYR